MSDQVERKRVGLRRVARASHVSTKTAGLALRGRDVVSADTAERIKEAAQKLGYARTRRSGNSSIIITVADLNDPFYLTQASALSRLLQDAKYQPFILPVTGNLGEYVQELESFSPLTTIMFNPRYNDRAGIEEIITSFGHRHVTVIDADPTIKAGPNITRVDIDYVNGVSSLMGYLFEQGHRRIAYLASPDYCYQSRLRVKAYEDYMQQNGQKTLLCYQDPTFTGPFNMIDAELATKAQILSRVKLPTAIVFDNDLMVLGGTRAIRQRSLSVPEDISVAGARRCIDGQYMNPVLVSLDISAGSISDTVMQETLYRLKGVGTSKGQTQTLQQIFINGESIVPI